jgi:hypothetical protein
MPGLSRRRSRVRVPSLASLGGADPAAACGVRFEPMQLPLILFGAIVAFVVLAVALSWNPRRARESVAERGHGPDYGAMAEIEAHDTDDMLDGIGERRRRTGGRDVGEELADELVRGTWHDGSG